MARSKDGCKQGFFFAAKGGYNDKSHNHNDVGNFVLYYNGYPVFIDVGVGTYTAKTFSNKRYEIWTMQSEYHNL
ncbi:MAG: heparinase II/III-family protein, partial [Firmicutes bacterium]|nr:heparinase II/III-family protein [Bacillota bacterium]